MKFFHNVLPILICCCVVVMCVCYYKFVKLSSAGFFVYLEIIEYSTFVKFFVPAIQDLRFIRVNNSLVSFNLNGCIKNAG